MSVATATHVINWKSRASADANKPPVTIITTPENITVGDPITIALYSAYPHRLTSPYDGLGRKTVASINPAITQVIDLSGSTDISTDFPVASIVSAVAAIALVDETTRTLVLNSGQPLDGLLSVVNQRLVVNSTAKLHGSIRVVYRTFPAQIWSHRPFTQKGAAMLFAQNLTTQDYVNVPLTISDRAAVVKPTIKIDGYPIAPHLGINPYAGFIVYPASADVVIETDAGTVTKKDKVSHLITREQLTFAGKTTNVAFVINELVAFVGYFFDAKHKKVTPKFTVSNGTLVSNVDCYGVGYLTYKTDGVWYEYNAELTVNNTGLFGAWSTRAGTVFAFDKNDVGITATYDIPLAQVIGLDSENVLEVYREVVVVGDTMYEMPDGAPAYPDGNGYLEYPDAGDEQKPPLGDAGAVTKWIHEAAFVNGNSVGSALSAVTWYAPSDNITAFNAKFKLTDNVPTSPSEAFPQPIIDALNAKKANLIAKYGITV